MQPDKYGPMTLESFEGLIKMQVREKVFDPSKWDDCEQEARIRVWEILRDRPEVSRGYIARATGRRIAEVSIRGLTTGHSGKRGKSIDPLRRDCISLDALSADPCSHHPVYMVDDDKQRRVAEAISTLSPCQQEYVRQRFLEGKTLRKVTLSSRNWYEPRYGARDKLRDELRDLAA
jgi:DNA-directed RNA polymerase specialized sigma24 family protein